MDRTDRHESVDPGSKGRRSLSAFLRTYKPMLRRARGTASYQDVRTLIQLWIHAKQMQNLLDAQNRRLFEVARELDARKATP